MGNKEKQYIAYYRVSTQQQGRSGLGLEAQQHAVKQYVKGELLAEYTDIESGKNNNRPALRQAIAQCQGSGATLIVAKLDRLSRNSVFIGQLMESKIMFECCDMPDANNFTIHIFAALAEQERKMISERTIAAQQAARERGVKFGNPKADKAAMELVRSYRKPKQYDPKLIQAIKDKVELGKPFHVIAADLTASGFKTYHGKDYSAASVWRIAKKL